MLDRATRAPSRYPDAVLVEIDGTAHAAACAIRACNQNGPARVTLVAGRIGERQREIIAYAEYLADKLECNIDVLDADTRNFMAPYATERGFKEKVAVCVHWSELAPASDAPAHYTHSYPMLGWTNAHIRRFLDNHGVDWPSIFDDEPEFTGPPPAQMLPLRRRRAVTEDETQATSEKLEVSGGLPLRSRTRAPVEPKTPSAPLPLRKRKREPVKDQSGFFE